MPKKPKTLARLKKDLDILFARFIRERDSKDGYFTCIACGKTKPVAMMHSGHFYARVFTATRWDEANSNGECSACNTFLHGNLLNYRKGMLDKYGYGEVNRLELEHNKPVKLDRQWLEEKIEHYKQKLKC